MVSAEYYAVASSLVLLSILLLVLSARALFRYWAAPTRSQLMWGGGLVFATGAMIVEAAVYLGSVSSLLLQTYVFFSAAIVGVLSLGATKILRSPRVERGYTVYIAATVGLVGVFSYLTPLPPASMVTGGIITGNPPLLLLILSSVVTGPATIVLLTASYLALRRAWRWQTLLMIGGALILGAGGTLYIASFPVALYYAEFVGIILLFLGLVSLPQSSSTVTPVSAGQAS
ncbi:MAG: hypothetical protein L3K10_05110 [Thermoplasmata archaeon]|nr:hypothetical protein [Thermoplasmata archaeon]